MCIVSIYKQLKKGFAFDVKMLLSISGGSVVGGFLGETIFSLTTQQFDNAMVKMIQSVLLLITVTGQLVNYELSMVPFLIIAAIFGGYLGTCLNHRLDNQKIERLYSLLMLGLMVVTIVNIVRN